VKSIPNQNQAEVSKAASLLGKRASGVPKNLTLADLERRKAQLRPINARRHREALERKGRKQELKDFVKQESKLGHFIPIQPGETT
jgi:hypothetical protein